MKYQWFRFYSEALNDPKVQSLPPDLFKHWVNILCLACSNNGTLPETLHETAFALRLSETDTVTVLERLLNATLIDRISGGANGYRYAPHSWDKRQYKSDTSTDRVKRFRNRKGNVTETPPDTDTDTDKKDKSKDLSKKATRLKDDWELPTEWGRWAEGLGLKRDVIITQSQVFRDYWTAKAGKDAAKMDWQATWRNWIRKYLEARK